MIQQLFNISSKERVEAVEVLFEHSMPSKDFFLMIVLSVLMATFGLLIDSSAVIVGSMLIAPILYPILGLAIGITMADFPLIIKSFRTFAKAALLGVAIAAVVAFLFSPHASEYTKEIIERTKPSLLSIAIGMTAGLAAAFAMAKPKISETLPGVAISVALIPPLAVIGIGIARLNVAVLVNALLLFLINVVGVIFAASIVFSLMNFYSKREKAEEVVEKEEKKLEKEKELEEVLSDKK